MRPWSGKSSGLPGSSFEVSKGLIPRRYVRLLGLTGALAIILMFMIYFDKVPFSGRVLGDRLPPLYEKYNEFERHLPQHNEKLRPPEGKHARFIHFDNHQTSAGWGNALQELFLNAHLAIRLKRSYVFDNYTWDREPRVYSMWGNNMIPSRIPLSTMITGPLAGGALGSGYDEDVPRPVSSEYFKKVCPDPYKIDTKPINDRIGWPSTTAAIVKVYLEELDKYRDERCLQIPIDAPQIFHVFLFGMPYVLDIWPELKYSPVMTSFGWAPLILNAFENNRHLWEAGQPPSRFSVQGSTKSIVPPTADTLSSVNKTTRSEIPGLIALHIRRGDFEGHCNHLATWSAHFNGWNDFTDFPDQFEPPPGAGWGENTPANRVIYRGHCYPSVEQIVEKILKVRKEHRERTGHDLRRVYAMTNAKKPWLEVLTHELQNAYPGGWDLITSSREMKLNWEQKFVSQAVDMYVGHRAEVFIGNGFSSLTSNVAMLRQAFERNPNTTRFW